MKCLITIQWSASCNPDLKKCTLGSFTSPQSGRRGEVRVSAEYSPGTVRTWGPAEPCAAALGCDPSGARLTCGRACSHVSREARPGPLQHRRAGERRKLGG